MDLEIADLLFLSLYFIVIICVGVWTKKNLLSIAGLEIPRQSLISLAGFIGGWIIVATIIYVVNLIAN